MCGYPFQFKIKYFFDKCTCMWTPFIFIEIFYVQAHVNQFKYTSKKGYSLVDQRETNSNIRWQMIFIRQLMCYPSLGPFLFTNLIQLISV